MSYLIIEYTQLSIIINVIIRIATAVVFMFFLIPLFVKEAKVRNGLKTLRLELLLTGLIIFIINISGLFIILFEYLNYDLKIITELVTYSNSIGFLTYAILKLKSYTQRYTPENKALHVKFEKIENRELKKAANKK